MTIGGAATPRDARRVNYTIQEILDQLAAREDSRWEFKQVQFAGKKLRSPKRDVLADEIAAFANARGGVLLCGVTDDGQVQDLSGDELAALDDVLVELSTDSIKPSVRISTQHLTLPDGKVLAVEVPVEDALHRSPGGAYVRVGGTKREMTTEEGLRLAQRRGQGRVRSYDERPLPNTGFGTLDESLWKTMLSASGALAPETALRRLALLAHDDAGSVRATVAGVLLCSRRPDEWMRGASITAVCYRGTDRASGQQDAREIVGPLNRQVADAMAFAVRNMRVAARKDPARVDIPEYSLRALFEALVNAVAHRDYSMGGRVRLSMFRDRVEIQSPGTLANNLRLDDLGSRVATRNEALVSVLMRMPVEGVPGSEERVSFMERRGDGIEIIRSETRDLGGRLPLFDLPGEAEVRVVIPAALQEPTPASVVIGVRSGSRPVAGATLLALFPNRTGKRVSTDRNGEAPVELHSTHLPMTVFVAAPGHGARLETEWVPADRALAASLRPLPDGGSVIFPEGSGELPGLTGRLNPVRDALDRMYLYATNISINDGKPQPVLIVPGEELRLTDVDGRERVVRIVAIEGRAALVEYQAVPDSP